MIITKYVCRLLPLLMEHCDNDFTLFHRGLSLERDNHVTFVMLINWLYLSELVDEFKFFFNAVEWVLFHIVLQKVIFHKVLRTNKQKWNKTNKNALPTKCFESALKKYDVVLSEST